MQREELQKRNSELEEMLYRVEYMAMTDPLTGLYNRRRFNDVLKREFATTWRYQNELSCVMIDLVLKSIAGVLTESLREVDVATRYGGEEFALIMPHTSKRDAIVATNRIMEKIRASEVVAGDEVVRFTVSMGIADMNDVDTNDMDDLIRAADLALYEAKRLGRNQTVAYTKEILLNSEFPT